MNSTSELQPFLAGLNDNREGMRTFAIKKCVQLGASAVPGLIELLKEKEGYVADSSAQVLHLIGAPAIPGLLEAMKSPDKQTRWMATTILSGMGDDAKQAIDRTRPISARMSSVS